MAAMFVQVLNSEPQTQSLLNPNEYSWHANNPNNQQLTFLTIEFPFIAAVERAAHTVYLKGLLRFSHMWRQ